MTWIHRALIAPTVVVAAISGALTIGVAPAMAGPTVHQRAELVGKGAVKNDNFGSAVAISGTTLVVGAPGHSQQRGAVYVFTLVGSTWKQTAMIHAADGISGDHFGTSVDIASGWIMVGAPRSNALAGAVYWYRHVNGIWKQLGEKKGLVSSSFGGLGTAVSVSSSLSVAGAPNPAGSAFVFVYAGGKWIQKGKVQGFDTLPGNAFGTAVRVLSSTSIAVGAPEQSPNSGSVYIFDRNSDGVFTQVDEFYGQDPLGHYGGFSGGGIAVSGAKMVVGDPSLNSGNGRVFDEIPAGTQWTQLSPVQEYAPPIAGQQFGGSVAISGSMLAAGAPSALASRGFALVVPFGQLLTPPLEKLEGSHTVAGDTFGASIAMTSTFVAVGAPKHKLGIGEVYVFTY